MSKEEQKWCSPVWLGFCIGLSDSLASESAQCKHFVFAMLREKGQSSQPGSRPDLVQTFGVHTNAQLAADVQHVGKAQGELVFFRD